MKPPAPRGTRILEALLVLTAAWLLAPERSCAQLPPVPPATPSPCNRFNLGTEWKGAFTLTGTGSGTFPDGGSYRINESITAAPDFLASPVGVPGIWAGNVNETIHIDDIETHPDQAAPGGVRFTHITDDETIPQGPLFASTGQPGGGLTIDLIGCTFFEFDFDPSNNATTTTELGVQSTLGSVYFVGVMQGSIFNGPGVTRAPLSASGLALSTSASFSSLGSLLGEPADWTISLSLQPVLDVDLIVSIPQYPDWRPTAGLAENDTGLDASGKPNLLEIQALLINKSTGKPGSFIPDKITFQLPDASTEPGVAMNWPSKDHLASNPPPDLNFDKNVPENANFNIPGNGTQASITPLFPSTLGPVSIMLSPHDWGGWATLNVTATIADVTIQGHFQGDPNTNILLPKRQPGSHIADVWKTQPTVSVPLSTPDSDDSETNPDGLPGCVGDGLTLYEEYRGFMENGKHIEGDPHKKDFFIQNLIGADAEPGIWLFTALSQLNVHKDLQKDEMDGFHTPTGPGTGFGTRLINFNHGQGAHEVDQHGVFIVTCQLMGGKTFLSVPGVHGRPGITNSICMQNRDFLGFFSLNPSETHAGAITPQNALVQYDVGVAHELFHSAGVDHHGEGDLQQQIFTLLPPSDPRNTTGQAVFQLNGQNVRMLREKDNTDLAADMWQNMQNKYAYWQNVVANPSQFDPVLVEIGKDYVHDFPFSDFLRALVPYVGRPHAEHSGDDRCVMRYFFANAYPSADPSVGIPVFYNVTPGTEPVGASLCNSPAGNPGGVNDPNRTIPPGHPQPRYLDAARGDCQHQVCVNDKNPPGSN